MITYNYFGKEQKIYYDKLPNGLEVYLIPNKHRKNYHVELVCKYGSFVKEFIPAGEKDYFKIPQGTAHFLEHKSFDIEKGDVFAFYSKSGTYVNAGTTYFCTRYYLDGKKNLKNNIDYLLSMVYTPFFKEEAIENERHVINEEIKMYDDDPSWVLDYESKKALFHHYVNEKIAGTVSSIKGINESILTKTYNTFYQPSNMFFIASGNIEFQDILDIFKNNEAFRKIKSNYPVIIKKEKETKDVITEYKLLEEKVVIPKLCYSFKFDLDELKIDYELLRLYLNALFTYLFGESSDFNAIISSKKLSSYFYVDHVAIDNIYTLSIEAESEYADLFKEEVDKQILNIQITEEDFLRVKKIWISILVRSLDNGEAMVSSVVDDLIRNGKLTDQYELINRLNYEELLRIIPKLDFTNKSFILMVPKK